jgi:hypothetical protein
LDGALAYRSISRLDFALVHGDATTTEHATKHLWCMMRRCMLHDRSCNWPIGMFDLPSGHAAMTLVPSRIFPQLWQYCTNHVLPMPCMARHGTARHGILRRCHYGALVCCRSHVAKLCTAQLEPCLFCAQLFPCAAVRTHEHRRVRPSAFAILSAPLTVTGNKTLLRVGRQRAFVRIASGYALAIHSHRGCPLGAARRIPPEAAEAFRDSLRYAPCTIGK